MPIYEYSINKDGEIIDGKIQAESEQEVMARIQNWNAVPLAIRRVWGPGEEGLGFFGSRKTGPWEMIFFAEQLAALIGGGVPLMRALSMQSTQITSPVLAKAVRTVTEDVAKGKSLSQAVEKQSHVFDSLWVSMIQMGESTGKLQEALTRLSLYLEMQEDVKSRVKTALFYPAVLGIISIGVLAFFIIRIVPGFADIFGTYNIKMPMITELVIGLSSVFSRHFLHIGAGLVIAYLAFKVYLTTEKGSAVFENMLFSAPIFGNVYKSVLLERFLSTFSILIDSGVSMINALNILENVMRKNVIIRRSLTAVRADVSSGKALSEALQRTKAYPALVVDMIQMGEESGKLPQGMSTLSRYYAKKIDQFVRRFTVIIEPVMVVFVGGIVMVIVMSIMLPVFSLTKIH